MESMGRKIEMAHSGDDDLGPFKWLPGTWENFNADIPHGWNMIALPFATEPAARLNYRLLLNHYRETLKFTTVNKAVPNRGIDREVSPSQTQNQFITTLIQITTSARPARHATRSIIPAPCIFTRTNEGYI